LGRSECDFTEKIDLTANMGKNTMGFVAEYFEEKERRKK